MECGCEPAYLGPSIAQTCQGSQYLLFMTLLNSIIRSACPISQPCTRVNSIDETWEEYDFIVVGGGTSGSVVAGRLSEGDEAWNVLLLEAGGDEPAAAEVPAFFESYLGNEELDWRFVTEPQERACLSEEEARCSWPRGRVLGGCHVINGMLYTRGVPKDYDKWVEMGCDGWSFDEVLPYYLVSEDNGEFSGLYHGIGGPVRVERFRHLPPVVKGIFKGGEELGYPVVEDFNDVENGNVGFVVLQATTKNGTRVSTAEAYLRTQEARNRKNLHVSLNSTVTKIIIEKVDGKNKATGVEYIHEGIKKTIKVRKEVILSAGVFNSPHLLLLSGVGPKEDLEKFGIEVIQDLNPVGKNLHNHVSFEIKISLEKIPYENDLNTKNILEYTSTQTGPLSSTGLSQISCRLYSSQIDPESQPPDIQFLFHGYKSGCSSTGSPLDGANETSVREISFSPICLHPKSRGYVTLNSSDPLELPLLYHNYFSDSYELEVLLEAVRFAQKLVDTSVLKEKYGARIKTEEYNLCEEKGFEYDSDDYWRCAIMYFTAPENHQGGTCRMGKIGDADTVVDTKLKVVGVDALRVCDSAVFPTTVSGNNNGVNLMIGERCAEFIRENWSK